MGQEPARKPQNAKARKRDRRSSIPTTPQGLYRTPGRPFGSLQPAAPLDPTALPMPSTMGEAIQEIANLRAAVVVTSEQQQAHDAIVSSLRATLEEANTALAAKDEEIENTREFATRWEGACRMAMQTLGATIWSAVPAIVGNTEYLQTQTRAEHLIPPEVVALAQGARFKLGERTTDRGQLVWAELLTPLEPVTEETPIAVQLAKGERPKFTDDAKAKLRRSFLEDARLGGLQVDEDQLDAIMEAALSGDVSEVAGVEQEIARKQASPNTARNVPDGSQGAEEPLRDGRDGRADGDGQPHRRRGALPPRDVPGPVRQPGVRRRPAGEG